MIVLNLLVGLCYLIFIGFLIFSIYRHGVYGTFEIIKKAIEDFIEGIKFGFAKKVPHKNCKVIHHIAQKEIEIYGVIRSHSVLDHIVSCDRSTDIHLGVAKFQIEKETNRLVEVAQKMQTRPQEIEVCLHEDGVESFRQLSGAVFVYCSKCCTLLNDPNVRRS